MEALARLGVSPLDRRLRHRLLEPGLPQARAAAPAQDRPQLHRRTAGRRATSPSCARSSTSGAHRGCRSLPGVETEAQAAVPAARRVQPLPGLPVCPGADADRAPRDRRAARDADSSTPDGGPQPGRPSRRASPARKVANTIGLVQYSSKPAARGRGHGVGRQRDAGDGGGRRIGAAPSARPGRPCRAVTSVEQDEVGTRALASLQAGRTRGRRRRGRCPA